MKRLLFLLLILFFKQSYAQQNFSVYSNIPYRGIDVLQWNDDSYFTLASQSNNYLLIHNDKYGQEVWSRRLPIGLEPTSFTKTNTGVAMLVNDSHDCYVLKIDTAGTILMAKKFDAGFYEYGSQIKTNNLGQLVVAGGQIDTVFYSFGYPTGINCFLLILDSNLNIITEKLFSNGNYGYYSYAKIDVLKDNSIMYSGTCQIHNSANVPAKTFIAKFSSTGNLIWQRQIHQWSTSFPDFDFYSPVFIKCDSIGNSFIEETFFSTNWFDPPTINYSFYKLDTLGNIVWKDANISHQLSPLKIMNDTELLVTADASHTYYQYPIDSNGLMKINASGYINFQKLCWVNHELNAGTETNDGGITFLDTYDYNGGAPKLGLFKMDSLFTDSCSIFHAGNKYNFSPQPASSSPLTLTVTNGFTSTLVTLNFIDTKIPFCNCYETGIPITTDFSFNDSTNVVSFHNLSNRVKYFKWNFGDGSFDSLNLNPVHVYADSLLHQVGLSFLDSCGMQHYVTKGIHCPSAALIITGAFIKCNNSTTILTASYSQSGYHWNIQYPASDTTQSIYVAQPGTYIVHTTGCNNFDTAIVTNYPALVIHVPNDTTICAGEPVILYATGAPVITWTANNLPNGDIVYPFYYSYYLASGIDTSNGCIYNNSFRVQTMYSQTNFSKGICRTDSFYFNGHYLTLEGVYLDTLTNYKGCDSFITVQVYFQTIYHTTTKYICVGSSYYFNGHQLNSQGTYLDTLVSHQGCDSIEQLNLFILNSPNFTDTYQPICVGSSYNFNGQNLFVGGLYYDTLINFQGCDSIVILHLTLLIPDTTYTIHADTLIANATVGTVQWINCINNTVVSSSHFFITQPGGTYALTNTIQNCSETSPCHEFLLAGINNLENGNRSFEIYPNPTKELLVISYQLVGNANTIKIYDVLGRECISIENLKSKIINVSSLSSGVYFLKLTDEKGNIRMGKFVKE